MRGLGAKASIVLGVLATVLAFISAASADGTYQEGNNARLSGDYATALRIWRPLAEQGQKDAENGMGVLYHYGEGVPRDYDQAVKWYRLAMQHGSIKAEYNLGLAYSHGDGVAMDQSAALRYFTLAANDGLPQAQTELADEYGAQAPPDFLKASKYYREAAIQGYAPAEERLGILYAYGDGVLEDHITAYAWLTLAYDNAFPEDKPEIDAQLYTLLQRTPGGQVAEGRRLAARCEQSHYQDCMEPNNPPL
jgi:TPR repeat protein